MAGMIGPAQKIGLARRHESARREPRASRGRDAHADGRGRLGTGADRYPFRRTPRDAAEAYDYVRMGVLSALTNVVVLLLLTIYILYEAYQRFLNPPEILADQC